MKNGLYWFAVVVLAGLFLLLLVCGIGCTTRAQYRHRWTDANEVPQRIEITWSEGVGNTAKQDFVILLPDQAVLMFGAATMDQDAWIQMLRQTGLTLERMAEAYMNGPLSALSYGDGQPSK